jgi:tRNA1(Val) A37 N6-methylase TrmN6
MCDLIFLLDKKVSLYQPKEGFRTSQDAVLLAAACPAIGSETVLDMGCGVGGSFLCLLYRQPHLSLTGIDIDTLYLELAQKNVSANRFTASLLMHNAVHFRVNDPKARFDHIISNPPYLESEKHTPSPDEKKARARGFIDHEISLEAWIKAAFDNLKPAGSLTLIHRADKLDEIIKGLGKKFGATEIIPIYSKSSEPAKRVIVRTIKDRKTPCILHRGIVLHGDDFSFTQEADMILRDGLSFDTVITRK